MTHPSNEEVMVPNSPAPTGAGEAEIEAVAAAIRQQRNGAITPPSEGTDYDRRLAIAAIAALRRAQPPQPTGDAEWLSEDERQLADEQRKRCSTDTQGLLAIIDRLNSRVSGAEEDFEVNRRAAHLFERAACDWQKRAEAAEARVAELEKAQRFQIGQSVEMSSTFKYVKDDGWRGWKGFVSGVRMTSTGELDYEVSDDWPPDVGRTDGFEESDLSPRAALSTGAGEK